MTNVMTTAWEIANEGVAKFGGKVKEYFADALRIAWDLFKKGGNEVKEEMHTDYLVSHDNGRSTVTIAVRHHNKEIVRVGYEEREEIKDANRIEIKGVKLNGEGVFNRHNSKADAVDHHQHGPVLRLYNVTIGGKRHSTAIVKIDAATLKEIKAPMVAKFEKKKEAIRNTPSLETSYDKQVCKKCHSICHGDCQAN